MYLIAIAWMYVVVMMTIAEAASPNGTLLGAFFTFLLYGVLPLSIVIYILGTPGRKRRIKALQEAERQAALLAPVATSAAQSESDSVAPDAGGESAAAAQPSRIAPVREES
jgi:membrane protein implicated in regulation of membrane protease activity